MAVTADQVEVVLRAQTSQYQNDLRAADKTFTQVSQNIARNAANVNDATNNMGSNVGNIAAQFQDIGVTAASGMNPLIIALQQGTQLSAVLNQSVAAGVSPVRALGAAFMQIINPVSLGTIAIIALGTAAAQYFGSLITQGKVSNEELKEQEGLIREVAEKWGDAVPALKAYVDQLDRAQSVGDLNKATELGIEAQYATLVETVGNLRAEFAAARIDIQQLGGDAQEIDRLEEAFDDLEAKARAGTATAADLNAVVALIGQTTGSTTPGVASLSNVLGGLANAFAVAAQQAEIFRNQRDLALAPDAQVKAFNSNQDFVAEQERINGLTADELALEREIARVKAEAARGDTLVSDQQALDIANDRLAAEERRRQLAADEKGGTKAASAAQKEVDAVLELIEALEFEYSLLGKSAEEQAISNALRQAGAAATKEQRARIEELISATYSEQEAIRQLDAMSKEWATTLQGATRGFIDDLIEGKSAAEAFSNVLSSIANKLIDVGLDSLFGAKGFNIAGLLNGKRAAGGPVSSGGTYLVGEKGPELFTPSSAGNITPNHQLGGHGGDIVFAPVVDARGADEAAVARLETGLRRLAGEMVPTIRKEMSTASKKGR